VVTIRSLLFGNTAYCVKLNGEDLSRYSNKIESTGLRKCPYCHYLTTKVPTPIFYTVTDTVTDLVNTEHVGNNSRILGPVWCIPSIILTVKGG